ncbi:hypothetical protein K435DRAFT_838416 [Dendrothele bispora CBS 962.96]|uniref:Uncharacterized protein n=1 Tax=Dendrothele bispora (strain CBS 962.96) TaxID=1314807 RepID=A0A4S8M6B9_DENBC|nr:hypothetical protein K435DRAFT_838416 [Dendrothele bispora CBS 962.96]
MEFSSQTVDIQRFPGEVIQITVTPGSGNLVRNCSDSCTSVSSSSATDTLRSDVQITRQTPENTDLSGGRKQQPGQPIKTGPTESDERDQAILDLEADLKPVLTHNGISSEDLTVPDSDPGYSPLSLQSHSVPMTPSKPAQCQPVNTTTALPELPPWSSPTPVREFEDALAAYSEQHGSLGIISARHHSLNYHRSPVTPTQLNSLPTLFPSREPPVSQRTLARRRMERYLPYAPIGGVLSTPTRSTRFNLPSTNSTQTSASYTEPETPSARLSPSSTS